MPQPFSWKVCRCAQTSLARPGRRPLKLSTQAFVACHEIVKGENDEAGKMFLFFPMRFSFRERIVAATPPAMLLFPETLSRPRNVCRLGRLCRRMVSAVSMHCPAARRDHSAPTEPACILEQPVRCSGRQCPGRQFMPISTAIRIRSEWFFAPSFCLSRDVVLATVL